jgi:hypothetical protein
MTTPPRYLRILPPQVISKPLPSRPLDRLRQQLSDASHHPLWPFVSRLSCPGERLQRSESMARAQISANEYVAWKNIAWANNLSSALDMIFHRRGLTTKESLPLLDSILPREVVFNPSPLQFPVPSIANWALPNWLVLHLISNKVRSSACADALAPFLLWQARHLEGEFLRPASILTATQLATWKLQNTMGIIIRTFIQDSSFEHAQIYFNLLLEALSVYPEISPFISQYVAVVLNTMKERQLTLHSNTFGSLLAAKFLTVRLANELEDRMAAEDHAPTLSQLESLLRFYSVQQQQEDVRRIFAHIRYKRARGPGAIPQPIDPDTSDDRPVQVTRHHVTLLNSWRGDPSSIIRPLAQTLDESKETFGLADRLNKSRATRIFQRAGRYWRTSALLVQTTFMGFCKRTSTSAEAILAMLKGLLQTHGVNSFRRRAFHTIAIHALIRRKAYSSACELFDRYYYGKGPDRQHLDFRLIRLGIIAHTLAGNSKEAFRILVSCGSMMPKSQGKKQPVKPDLRIFNAFLASMHKFGRDDIVFKLWERMENDFGLLPNGQTLTIILGVSRRISCSSTNSLKSIGNKPRITTWAGAPAWQTAREVFRQMLSTSFPQIRINSSNISTWSKFGERRSSIAKCTYPFPVSQGAFKAYLNLLASASSGDEIPEVLEWMHQLQVPFTAEMLSLATVGWEEYNSSARGIMYTAGHGRRFLQWLRASNIDVQDRWPTERDLWAMRRQLYFEKHPPKQMPKQTEVDAE